MKAVFAALAILSFSAVATLAETADGLSRVEGRSAPPSETVHRGAPAKDTLGEVHLVPAEVEDVDIDRDGKVSFAELLLYDMDSGF